MKSQQIREGIGSFRDDLEHASCDPDNPAVEVALQGFLGIIELLSEIAAQLAEINEAMAKTKTVP